MFRQEKQIQLTSRRGEHCSPAFFCQNNEKGSLSASFKREPAATYPPGGSSTRFFAAAVVGSGGESRRMTDAPRRTGCGIFGWTEQLSSRRDEHCSPAFFLPKQRKKEALRLPLRGNRQRPILPGRVQPSTFGTGELNYCVRYGNRWDLSVITTGRVFDPFSFTFRLLESGI